MRKFPDQAARLCVVAAIAMSAVLPCYSQASRSAASKPPKKKLAEARDNRGVSELRKLSDLKAEFDQDNGKIRLVVLVSPT